MATVYLATGGRHADRIGGADKVRASCVTRPVGRNFQ
jgi:hypothetical protein